MGIIYLARNTVNGKGYVGKTINPLDDRIDGHQYDAYNGVPYVFHRAIRKYGWDAFEWSILCEDDYDEDDEWLLFMEVRFIKKLGTKLPNGYNMTDGGGGASGAKRSEECRKRLSEALTGRVVSEETKRRLSEAAKRRGPVSDETRAKMREKREGKPSPMRGTVLSDEIKKKISEALIGHAVSEETKAKIGAGRKGKTHTQESKDKMSASRKGKKIPDHIKEKYGDSTRGKTYEEIHGPELALELKEIRRAYLKSHNPCKSHSPEIRAKISASNKGKKRSEETKEKMRLGAIEAWKKRKLNQCDT